MSPRDVYVFHKRFLYEPDETFEEFLETLYPEGCTIGKDEIEQLVDYVYNVLQKDEQAKDFYLKLAEYPHLNIYNVGGG